MIKINSTRDISPQDLQVAFSNIASELDINISSRQYFFKSTDPPSWIQLIAELDWWIKIFGAWAALFVAEYTKEAAKHSWKATTNLVTKLYKSLKQARKKARPDTYIEFGTSFPNKDYPSIIKISCNDEEKFIQEFALFINYLPKFKQLMGTDVMRNKPITGWVFLELDDKGNMKISFMNADTLEKEHFTINL